LYILARANGRNFEPPFEERLTALLDHLMYITRPDGTTPFFGDDDGGRLVMLGESAPNDFRAALSTGAALFARADYKYVAGEAAEETVWLLGTEGLGDFDRLAASPPEEGSRAFFDGGYYVMRDGWTQGGNYLLIDCGPHGTLNCGHAHADALSLEVAARGRTVLVDPGTYTYTGSSVLRDAFRSSRAHNTLTIDDESSSVPGGPFGWRHVAEASMRAWTSRERFDYFEGSHDGYARLAEPAIHERSILFLKDDYWIMRDRVATEGAHQYELRFQFAASADPSVAEAATAGPVLSDGETKSPRLELFAFAAGGGGEWRKEEGSVSICYGERKVAPVCVFSKKAEGAQDFVTFLVPIEAGDGDIARIRELEAEGGRAFEVTRGGARDLLLLGDGRRTIRAAGVASDFAWAWLRFELDSGHAREMVLLDGERIETGAEELFKAARRTTFAVVRRVGDELSVETDAGIDFTVASLGAGSAVVNGQATAFSIESVLRFMGGRPDAGLAARQAAAETLR
ncbi:MAG TPA: alginate lyase family protein, partial [Pyrinomonadaceae bacterium]|nr:alginate lyase family protein [Pyrinomonadaceae bacterium]